MATETYVTALAGGASVLIGKIVWEFFKKPVNGNRPVTLNECDKQHKTVAETMKDMKDDQKIAFQKIDKIYDHLLEKK